jgi:hypothetical protein
MNLKDLSRPLEISDVDFRVQSINNGGYATILAYKDARVDMNRLDEVLTPLGWQRDYKLIDGKLFCGVGIWFSSINQWVWKWDVGTESNTEKEKGQASDAFKRACFNFGIGRELYSYPIISVKLKTDEWEKKKDFNGKERAVATWDLKIKDWRWYSEFTDGALTFLAAKDQNGEVRFKWGTMKPKDVEPSYTPASGGEPTDSTEELVVKEEGNVEGVLKKSAEPVAIPSIELDAERDTTILEYEAMFGKKPHGRMSTENIKKEIQSEVDRLLKLEEEVEEVKQDDVYSATPEISIEIEEEEEEIEEAPLDSIVNHFDSILEHRDANEFVKWAKELVSKYIAIDDEITIEEFKDLCNNHYQKIK